MRCLGLASLSLLAIGQAADGQATAADTAAVQVAAITWYVESVLMSRAGDVAAVCLSSGIPRGDRPTTAVSDPSATLMAALPESAMRLLP